MGDRAGAVGSQVNPPLRQGRADDVDILVAAPAEAEQDDRVGLEGRRERAQVGDGVAGLERGDDALVTAKRLEALERFVVGDRDVFSALGDP